MAPVTIAAGDIVAAGSGSTGWAARSLFVHDFHVHRTATSFGGVQALNGGVSGTNAYIGQSFTLTTGGSLEFISAYANKAGSPTDDVYVEIQTDSSDTPSGTVVATSDVIAASSLQTSVSQLPVEFFFATPPTLSASTKYWMVFKRSGARDTTNRIDLRFFNSGVSGLTTYNTSWAAESASLALTTVLRVGLATKPLYIFTQDSGGSPKLHAWKSTDDGATWTEIDASNAPSVSNGAYPFSLGHQRNVLPLGITYFSATNTIRFRSFDPITDTWGSDLGGVNINTGIANTRPVRMAVTDNALRYMASGSSSADDADLINARWIAAAGVGETTYLAITSAEASTTAEIVHDAAEQNYYFYYDAANDDFTMVSQSITTFSTHVDIDATAATSHAGHHAGGYEPYYVAKIRRVTAAYIDANNTINERTVSMGVVSASATLGTQRQVTSSTAYAGGKLSTCAYDGDRYVFASKADGTSIDYWISTDDTTSNTWGSVNNVLTGTGLHLAQALPVAGVGIIIIYQNGSDVVVDWAVDGPVGSTNATGTVSVGTVTASGQSITGTATTATNVTGTVSVGTVASSGQSVTATFTQSATATITEGSVTASGEAVSASYGVSDSATIAQGTITTSGQSVTGTFGVSDGATVSAGTIATSGQSVSASFTVSATGTVSVGTIAATGQSVSTSASTSVSATITEGAITASGETITGTFTVSADATITEGTAAATGEAIAATFGQSASATVSPGTVNATGESVTVTATTSATGTITAGTIAATGESVTASAGVSVPATVNPGTIAASGQTVTSTAGGAAFGLIDPGTIATTGQSITASFTADATAIITPGTLAASGQSVAASAGGSVTGVVQVGTLAASGLMVVASATVSASGTVNAGAIVASGYLVTVTAGQSVTATIEPGTIVATGYTVFVGDPPPTVFGPLMAATMRGERLVTGTISDQRAITGVMTEQRVLTGRMRVNE